MKRLRTAQVLGSPSPREREARLRAQLERRPEPRPARALECSRDNPGEGGSAYLGAGR